MNKKTNPLALWSLFSGVMLLAPVAVVLGVWALIQIRRQPEKGDGAPFAIMGLILGGILLPAGAAFVLTGSLPALDGCRSLQQEGAAELRLIAFLQVRHHDKSGRYGATFEDIGFLDPKTDSPYNRSIVSADAETFVARAEGTGPLAGDIMEVGPAGEVKRLGDACHRD